MIKTKYTISVEGLSTDLITEMQVSREEFHRQISNINRQLTAHRIKNDDNHFEKLDDEVFETDTYTKIIYTYLYNTTYTVFIKYECKEGYKFKTKKEARSNKNG